MNVADAAFVGKQFKVGLRRQKTWGADMAISFFLGESGAGLFLLSLCLDYIPGVIAGLLIATIGKSVGHSIHLGRPERAWRAILMLKNSWLSRGLLSIILFSGFGGIYVLNHFYSFLPEQLVPVCAFIAGASSIVVMLYQGLIMSHSASISLWASGLMPVIGMVYALLMGSSIIHAFGGEVVMAQAGLSQMLTGFQLMLLLILSAAIWGLLHAAHFCSRAGQESVYRLVKGDYKTWFVGGVLILGIGVTAYLVAFASASQMGQYAALASLTAGFVIFRLLMLKAGNYDPILNFTPRKTHA